MKLNNKNDAIKILKLVYLKNVILKGQKVLTKLENIIQRLYLSDIML